MRKQGSEQPGVCERREREGDRKEDMRWQKATMAAEDEDYVSNQFLHRNGRRSTINCLLSYPKPFLLPLRSRQKESEHEGSCFPRDNSNEF